MTASPAAGNTAAAALTLRAGEPFVLHIALRDAAGSPQLLSGRSFALLIAAVGATTPAISAPATLSGDALYAVATLTGTQTAVLHADFGTRTCTYAIVETVGDAQLTRGGGSLHVEASAAIPSDGDPATIDLPYALAIPTPAGLLITETGARGLSAAEQFAIGGLDGGDPMTDAMFAALQAPALAAAESADAAAANADEKAAMAQGVVDAQAVNLATIAAAVVQTGDDVEATAADRDNVAVDRALVLAAQSDVTTKAAQITDYVLATAADAVAAEGYRALAALDVVAAENAAAAAAAATTLRYPDAAAGLAATVEGGYFFVAGAGPTADTRYRKVGGAATLPLDYASKAALDATIAAGAESSSTLQVAAIRSVRDLSYVGGAGVVPDVTAIDDNGIEHVLTGWRQSDGAHMFYAPIAGDGVEQAINDQVVNYITDYNFIGNGNEIPLWMIGNRAVAYYDKALGRIVLSDVLITGDNGVTAIDSSPALVPYRDGLNGVVVYGQSLSIGEESTPAITTAQPFYNVSFAGGVKAKNGSGVTSLTPLVEDNNSESGTVTGTNGETICSALANHATRLAAIDNGTLPTDFRTFAFAPGKGGQPISALIKGTALYSRMMDLIASAVADAAAIGKSITFQTLHWLQGEYENTNAGFTRAGYAATLMQLQADVSADVKALTGQVQDLHFMVYQTLAYSVSTGPGLSAGASTLGQFDAVNQSPYFHFVAPLYQMPHATDRIHMINVGEAWHGHYHGRAFKQLVVDGRDPDCVWPVSAILIGSTLTIRFTAPAPLTIDATNLFATTDFGFKVSDESGSITLSSIQVANSYTVTMTLSRTTGASIVVRYGLDYEGSSSTLRSAGTGNLRDTTADTCTVNGVTKQLWHLSPHFELTVVKLGA